MWLTEDSPLGRIVVPPSLPPGFALFATTRDYPGKIVAHELTGVLRERFGVEATLTTCVQIHSATVTRARHEHSWRECDSCDALWTDERHVALGIKVADCLPVSLIDPGHHVIANIHERGPARAALTGQDGSDFGCQMPDGLTRRIHYVPFSLSSEILAAGKVC